MTFQDQMPLWNDAALQVLDVRHRMMRPGESLRAYRLPSSLFLFATRGKALVSIDEIAYEANSCLVCHAGKGAMLDIARVAEGLEYYMVFYKAVWAAPGREPLRLDQTDNPFHLQYGFVPQYPLSLYWKAEEMNRCWQQGGMLETFHVKALFHQFVYELLRQRHDRGEGAVQPNPLSQAIRYIEECYAEPLTLPALAAMLGCNARRLQRLFNAKLHVGPMEYLIRVRLDKAKLLLQHTDVPIVRIAEAVGYSDSYYFSRLFKKYFGVSPRQFQEQVRQAERRRQNPFHLSQSYIVPGIAQMYSNTSEDETHYQLQSGAVVYKGGVGPNRRRYIKHLKGETELKRAPQRIAVLDCQYIDQLLALGERPVGSVSGTTDAMKFPEYLSDRLAGIQVLGTKEAPDLAAVARSAPDLIICTEFQESVYEELSRIAPTVMFDRYEDWRITLLTLGQMVGKEREAMNVVNEYNRKIAALKAALAGNLGGETVALIRPRDNKIRLHMTAHRTAKILYRDLGMAAPAMAVDDRKTSSYISLDAMPKLNADRLFVLKDDSNAELTDRYQQTSVWNDLSVVQANRVRTVNTTLWIGYYGPIAVNRVVDEIAEALLQPNSKTS